ncbi:MAG: nuclear transport factor 2 family protein [Chitinophagaceae bacterium]
MKLTKKLEAEIKQVMDDYWNSYFDGNLDHWANYLVEDYRNIGGTEEEIWNSKKEILDYTNRVINQMKGASELRNKQIQIIAYDPYIMVHELLDIYIKVEDEWTFYQKFRLSSLIQKTGEGWKVLHQHGSYPDSKTQEGEAFAFDTLKNENLKLQEAIKNRTKELESKNRELEIETAFEKVRAIALSMKQPADMLEVCKTISHQLEVLSVKEIRNVQTAIFYKEKGTYMNYEYYLKHNKTFITETNYKNNEKHAEFAENMQKGNGEFFELNMQGNEIKDWIDYQKTTNVFIDDFLYNTSSLNYYWHSLERGCIRHFNLCTFKRR